MEGGIIYPEPRVRSTEFELSVGLTLAHVDWDYCDVTALAQGEWATTWQLQPHAFPMSPLEPNSTALINDDITASF